MKILLPVDAESKTSSLSPVFARASYFAVYDTDTKLFEFLKNPIMEQSRGAGMAASQFALDRGVSEVVTSQIGPNAESMLKQAGVTVTIEKDSGKTIEEIISSLVA